MGSIQPALERARSLSRSGDRDGALRILDELKGRDDLTVQYHLFRAAMIQLSNREDIQLSDAQSALESALQLDPNDCEALVDMGLFLSRVMNDEEKALPYLHRGLERLCIWYADALVGVTEIARGSAASREKIIDEELGKIRNRIRSIDDPRS